MKLLIVLLIIFYTAVAHAATVDVMSYNIRCASCETIGSPNHWENRKFFVAHMIHKRNPDVIGLQEAEINQVEDLVEMLDDYSWIGVGREDGKEKGETTAILFRHSRFNLQSQQTRWLSPAPHQASLGWDAHFRRTLTIATLVDKTTQQSLIIFNTHFDNAGEIARQESAKLLLAEITRIKSQTNSTQINDTNDSSTPGKTPQPVLIVTGDFNAKTDSETYRLITSALVDAEKISATPAIGGNKTYNAFGEDKAPGNKIDFIFVEENTMVTAHEIDSTTYNGQYPSDHFAVFVRVDLLGTN